MLPLVDKPIIQYGVEEAVASGISNIILVTGRGKNAIEDHFDVSVELESFLEARGKREQLVEVRKDLEHDQLRLCPAAGFAPRPAHLEGQHMAGFESGIHPRELLKTAQQRSGAN